MSFYALQLHIPNFRFQSLRKSLPLPFKLHPHLNMLCIPPHSYGPDATLDSEIPSNDSEGERRVILVEKYGNGTSKRYILDNDSQIRTFLEKHVPPNNGSLDAKISDVVELSLLPQIVKDLFFPTGYPGSVSEDYLAYMLLQFPTNVTGWICHTLVTSSLLKDLSQGPLLLPLLLPLGYWPGDEIFLKNSTCRWVSKDGIGAVGRLFIGGRFGNLFDDDPKQWRMYADFIGSAGSIFDLSTQLYPAYFLPLASLGNLAKAVARGLKDPSSRVIQSHFAISGNLGEVAAKEEVWEVSAELLGLALGIVALDTLGLSSSYSSLALTWLSIRLLHLWFRYLSLSVLQFNTINLKRACILVNSHVSHSMVPGCSECNRRENILIWLKFSKPRIIFGVPLDEMVGGEKGCSMVTLLLKLYKKEKYFLTVNRQQLREFEVFVSFKEGATSLSVLRSVWQTYWLYQNWNWSDNVEDQLKQSLTKLDDRFDDFLQQLASAGWDISQLNLKVPKEISIKELDAI